MNFRLALDGEHLYRLLPYELLTNICINYYLMSCRLKLASKHLYEVITCRLTLEGEHLYKLLPYDK